MKSIRTHRGENQTKRERERTRLDAVEEENADAVSRTDSQDVHEDRRQRRRRVREGGVREDEVAARRDRSVAVAVAVAVVIFRSPVVAVACVGEAIGQSNVLPVKR